METLLIARPLFSAAIKYFRDKAISYGFKRISQNIFAENELAFDNILDSVASRIGHELGYDLFGNRIYEVLKKEKIRTELLKILDFTSDGPDYEIIKEEIDENTLPENFLNVLGSFLIEEIIKEGTFKKNLQDTLLMDSVFRIPKIEEILAEIYNHLQIGKQELEIEKPKYSFSKVYIERQYADWDADSKNSFEWNKIESKAIEVIEILKSNPKILILAEGGFGKSTQLDYLATYYSNEEESTYPIKVSLKNYTNEIETLISAELPEWEKVPQENLLFIFDALDEVRSDLIEEVVRKINVFATQKKLRKSRFVLSCRTNLFQSNKAKIYNNFEGFKVFRLLPISWNSREKYIKETLGEYAQEFNNEIYRKNLGDLLQSAFYLVNLVSLFNKSKSKRLPQKIADIYENILSNALEEDKSKIEYKKLELFEFDSQIANVLEKLAMAMNIMGANELPISFYDKLVPAAKLRKLLNHISLIEIDNAEKKRVVFVHNTIKEFLSARLLSKVPFEDIKKTLFHPMEYRKFKDKWLNSLSFLQSIFEGSAENYLKLKNWLIENDSEVIIGFELDKIDITKREEIFFSIAKSHWSKGINLYSNKFNDNQLVEFSGKGRSVVGFIISEISNPTSQDTLLDAIYLLKRFDSLHGQEKILERLILRIITNEDYKVELRSSCIDVLTEFKLCSSEIFHVLLKKVNREKSAEIRESIYRYIMENDLSDDFYQYLLEGLNLIKQKVGVDERRYTMEDSTLVSAFKLFKNKLSWETLFDYLIANPSTTHLGHQTNILEILGNDISRIILLYPELYGKLISLIEAIDSSHDTSINLALRKIIESIGKSFDTFKYFFERSLTDNKYLWLYPVFTDQTSLSYFISKSRSLSDSERRIWVFINCVRESLPNYHEECYRQINEAFDNNFQYVKQKSWEDIRKEQRIKDLELLEDRVKLLKKIKNIFLSQNSNELTKDALWELRKGEDLKEDNLTQYVLHDYMEKDVVCYSEIESALLDNTKWDWFRIHHYYLMAADNRNAEIQEPHLGWIKEWCLNESKNFDFSEVYFQKNGTLYYNKHKSRLANYFRTFLIAYNFDFPEEKLLNMLWFTSKITDQNSVQLITIIEQKVAKSKIIEQIIINLNTKKIFYQPVLEFHIEYCIKNYLKRVLPLLPFYINDWNDRFIKYKAIEAFKTLNGDYRELELSLPKLTFNQDENWERHLIMFLIDKKSKTVVEWLSKMLNETAEGDPKKLEIANYLIFTGNVSGLKYICEWFKKNRINPQQHFVHQVEYSAIGFDDAFPVLCEMLITHYEYNVGRDPFHGIYNNVEKAIHFYSLQSHVNFVKINETLRSIVEKHKSIENLYQLNYLINEIERRYYLALSDVVDEREVLEMVENLNMKINN